MELDGLDMPDNEPAAPIEAPVAEVAPETPPPQAEPPVAVAPTTPETPPPRENRPVPLAAHIEERNELKARARAAEERATALENEIKALKNPPPAPVAPPAEPDRAADPAGWATWKSNQAIEALKGTVQSVQQTAEGAAQDAAQTRFFSDLQTAESTFRATTPDYQPALDHVRNVRAQQLQILYPDATQKQIVEQIGREELTAAAGLLRAGRNPAEFAYQYAKTLGYKPTLLDKLIDPAKAAEAKAAATPGLPSLPNVAAPETLSPSDTLGSGSGTPNVEGDEAPPDGDGAFDAAFGEIFGRKKRA